MENKCKGELPIMRFTEEQIDAIIPDLANPITEDEYLEALMLDNEGFDFGAILHYSSESEDKLNQFLKTMM